MTIRHDAQIPTYSYLLDRDPGALLGLVVAYPRGFLIQMIFFHFWTLWVLSGLRFFKSAW